MSLENIWKNKVDGVDDVLAEDINNIAQAIIQNEKDITEQDGRMGNFEEELSGKADISQLNTKADKEDTYTKEEVDTLIGENNGNSAEWKKIADITTTEEVNSVIATSEEFPDIPKCKEFIIRAVFPVSPTSAGIPLGATFCYLNDNTHTAYRFTATTINASAITEQRTHIIIAGSMIYSTGTQQASGQGSVTTQAYTLIGNRFISEDVTSIIYKLNESESNYPIGIQLIIYGKVES